MSSNLCYLYYLAVMQPVKPFTFGIGGLTATEFKECLSSKVYKLFNTQLNTQINAQFSTQEIIALINNCIIEVTENASLRENITNNSLNKRLSKLVFTNQSYNEQITIMRNKLDTGGIVALYHHLFEKFLIPKFTIIFDNITFKEDNNGFLFSKDSNKKLTFEENCYVIDQITLKYIEFFCQLNKNTVRPDHDNYQKRAEIQFEYECCLLILMSHRVVDWSKESDLMDKNRYIAISYAALSVVLDMILSRLDNGWNSPPPVTTTVNYDYVTSFFIKGSVIIRKLAFATIGLYTKLRQLRSFAPF